MVAVVVVVAGAPPRHALPVTFLAARHWLWKATQAHF
jgi:hypothetical protein